MRYLVHTFGCQMNVHDSRRIDEVLREHGYEPTDEPTLADLVVFNTCSVREKAEHKLRSAVGTYRPLKDARPGLVIAIAGCVAQQEGEKLLARMPYVDLVIGPDNIPELPGLVQHALDGAAPTSRTVFDTDSPRFLTAKPRAEITSFVTVMKGCDERCTFCIVPTTRGPERYRAADDVVREVTQLAAGGVREVTLLGQTVNSWFDPTGEVPADGDRSQFALLLRRIAAEVPELARLRYTSPHPRHLTPELIRAHAELDVLPAHVHLPVQSGSDRMLRRMSRRYTRAEYVARARALQSARPGLTLSTDVIVGFPGETEANFAETLSLVQEVGFVAAFGFSYSPRPGTPALKLGDDVPAEVKEERLARFFALVETQQQAHLRTLVGQRTRVLVEGPSRDGSARVSGRSDRHEIVHVETDEGAALHGRVVDVTIVEAFKHSLLGRLEGAAPLPRPTPRAPRLHLPITGGSA